MMERGTASNDLTLPNEGGVGSQFSNLRISIDEDWDNERYEVDGAALMRFNNRMPPGSLTTLFSTATPTSTEEEDDQDIFLFESPTREIEQEDFVDNTIVLLSDELLEQGIADLDSLQDVESAVSENDDDYERQAWEAWNASGSDSSEHDSESETSDHFRQNMHLRRYGHSVFELLERRIQAYIAEHGDIDSDVSDEDYYENIVNYHVDEWDSDTDSQVTARTEGESPDSDDEFYIPYNIDVAIRPQAGEFDHQNSEYNANETPEEKTAKALYWQERFLRPITKSALTNTIPDLPAFQDLLGHTLEGMQTMGNLKRLIDVTYVAYTTYQKISENNSLECVSRSLLEAYMLMTGTRISDFIEMPTFIKDCFLIAPALNVEAQAGNFGPGALLQCWKTVLKSSVVEKLKKLSSIMAAMGIANLLGVKLTEGLFGKIWSIINPFLKQTDMFAQVCECIQFIYEKCAHAFSTKSWAALADGCNMKDIDNRVASLAIVYENHMTGLVKDGDMDLLAACSEADDLVRLCKRYGALSETKSQRTAFASQQIKVGLIHSALADKLGQRAVMPAPYVTTFVGEPGVGKSANVTMAITLIQRKLGMPVGPEHVYTIQSDDPYLTGYTKQGTVVMDDLANATADTAEVNPANQVIGMINNAKKVAKKAAVEEKGKSVLVAKHVVITGNRINFQANKYSVCPGAVLRRLGDVIILKVKPEYRIAGGEMLDPTLDVKAMKYDVWNASVVRYNTMTTEWEPMKDEFGHLTEVGMPRVYKYLTVTAKKHHDGQNRLVRQIDELALEAVCQHDLFGFMCPDCELLRVAENTAIPNDSSDIDLLVEQQSGTFETAARVLALSINSHDILEHVYVFGVRSLTFIVLSIGALCFIIGLDYHMNGYFGASTILSTVATLYSFYHIYKEYISLRVKVVAASNFETIALQARNKLLGKCANSLNIAYIGTGLVLAAWLMKKNKENIVLKRRLINNAREHDITTDELYEQYARYNDLAEEYRQLVQVRLESQGSVVGFPKRPEIANKTIWSKNHIEPRFTSPLNPHTTGVQLAGVMTAGLTIAYFHKTEVCDSGATCMSMPICTYNTLVPTHILKICESEGYKYMTIQRGDTNTHNGSNTLLLEGTYEPIPGTDYSIVYAPSIRDQKNIVKFFPKRSLLSSNELNLVNTPCRISYVKPLDMRDEEGKKYKILQRFEKGINVRSGLVQIAGMPPIWGGSYEFPENTYNGACCAVIVTEGPDSFIAGLHCAGIEGMSSARFNTIYQEDIEAVLNKMTGPDTAKMQGAERTEINLDFDKFQFIDGLTDKPHQVKFTTGEFAILGSHKGQIRTNRSAVIVSPISETITELTGVERKHGAPSMLNDWSPGAVWLDAAAHAKQFPQKNLDTATSEYIKYMLAVCDEHPEWKEEIIKVHDSVVVNGFDGVKGVDALNFNASIGLPECRPKKEFLIPNDEVIPGISCNRTYNDDIMKKYHDMEDKLATGVRVYSPFRINVKDESTKLTSAKVRIFSGGENSLLMLLRKYFLTASAFMQKHMELFESAVGANCYGRDWDRLRKHITKHGVNRIIAGDYSKFDQYVTNAITLASFKILIALCMWAGYDEEDLVIMRGLATEVCNPVYEMNGVWLTLGSSTASGHSLTVVINGLNNCIYMRMAYNGLKPPMWKKPFKECVSLMTYGDDNVMSVSEDCDWFNHTSIQKWFGSYGITYTMAEKDEESVPFIHIDDATFLKRRWVWDNELKLYRCPLEKQSIFKMLHTVQKSKTVTVEQQIGDILQTANREFFQHGKEEFDTMQKVLLEVATRHDLMHYLPDSHMETYDELKQWMLE